MKVHSYQDTTDKVSNLNLVGQIRKTLEKDFDEVCVIEI